MILPHTGSRSEAQPTHARKQAGRQTERQPCYGIHEKQSFRNLTDENFSPLATTNSLSSQKDRFKAFHHKKIQSRASSKSMIAETKRPEAKISEERKLEETNSEWHKQVRKRGAWGRNEGRERPGGGECVDT
jgi:hypothetical protein